MEPYQERMYTEFKELNDRITKLTEFIYNETYKKFNLSEDEVERELKTIYGMHTLQTSQHYGTFNYE